MPLCKNQTLALDCTGLGMEFEGICRADGQVVFVRGALPGEQVTARVIKVAKHYAVGRLEAVQTPSPLRQAPPCPYFPRCGGCVAQHLSYPETLRHKRHHIADCMARIGGIDASVVEPPLGMDIPWQYRNKGAFPVGGEAGTPVIGIYAARSHAIVDAPDGCLLQTAQSNALVGAVRRWMAANHISPYDEKTHTGLVRHIMTREAADGSAMLVLVCNGAAVPHKEALAAEATRAVPLLRGIVLSENTRRTNVILGDRFATLWGEDTLVDEIAGFRMRVSPRSFFQVNRAQAERLYALAVSLAGLTGRERVWDLYCGCGSITLPLARHARHVTGVEVVQAAIDDAHANAHANGVQNVSFVAGATEDVLPALLRDVGAPDVVVLDPPRKGCDPAALAALGQARPRRIVYVSCNPATLARDIATLAEYGYAPGAFHPVDMFCWTGHVECVVGLTRVGK